VKSGCLSICLRLNLRLPELMLESIGLAAPHHHSIVRAAALRYPCNRVFECRFGLKPRIKRAEL